MHYRQKRNGMWLVDYLDDGGIRRRVSTGIKSPPQRQPPAEVKAAGREIVLGIRQSTRIQLPSTSPAKKDGRFTVSDLFDKCETTIWHPDNVRAQGSVRSNLKVLRSLIGDEAVVDVTYTRLEQLVSDMKARGYQPATIKRKLAMLGRALKMATMWVDKSGQPLLTYKPPLPQVVVNNLKERTISPAEEQAIFIAVEKRRQTEPGRQWFRFRVLLRFLFDTAGRLGESLSLGPASLTSMGGLTYVTFPRYRTKSGKPRTVPLAEASVDALGSLMDQLVLDQETNEWRFFGFTNNLAWQMFNQIRDDVREQTGLDLSDVTLHTIRHTTLTRLAQGGMDLARLQQWAGHSDPKITAERYLHLMPSDLIAGLAILRPNGTTETIGNADGPKHESVFGSSPVTIGATLGTETVQ